MDNLWRGHACARAYHDRALALCECIAVPPRSATKVAIGMHFDTVVDERDVFRERSFHVAILVHATVEEQDGRTRGVVEAILRDEQWGTAMLSHSVAGEAEGGGAATDNHDLSNRTGHVALVRW